MNRTAPTTRFERIASAVIFIGLLLFPTIMVLPASGKTVNNVAYILIILPTVLWLAFSPRTVLPYFQRAWAVWLFLGCVFLISVLHQQFEHAKSAVLTLLFCLSILLVLDRHPKAATTAFSLLVGIALILLVWKSQEWLFAYLATGEMLRLTLWGRAENPIYAGLLVISSLVFLWQLFSAHHSSNQFYQVAFMLGATLLCLIAAIIFQARTALIGLLISLAGWFYLKKQFRYVIFLFLILGIGLLLTGTVEALLNRGLSYRPEIWQDAVNKLYNQCNLLTGCGETEELFLQQFKGTHNGYIGTVYRHGLIAGIACLYFVLWYFYRGLRTASPWFVISLVGWGGMLTAMDGLVGGPHAWWVFFWFPTMAAIHDSLKDSPPYFRPLLLMGKTP